MGKNRRRMRPGRNGYTYGDGSMKATHRICNQDDLSEAREIIRDRENRYIHSLPMGASASLDAYEPYRSSRSTPAPLDSWGRPISAKAGALPQAILWEGSRAHRILMEREMEEKRRLEVFGGEVGDEVSLCFKMLDVVVGLFGDTDYVDP
jgi:hypothetical protein